MQVFTNFLTLVLGCCQHQALLLLFNFLCISLPTYTLQLLSETGQPFTTGLHLFPGLILSRVPLVSFCSLPQLVMLMLRPISMHYLILVHILCHSSDTLSSMAREDLHWLVPVWCCTGTKKVLACSRKGYSRLACLWEHSAAGFADKEASLSPPTFTQFFRPSLHRVAASSHAQPTPLVCGRW